MLGVVWGLLSMGAGLAVAQTETENGGQGANQTAPDSQQAKKKKKKAGGKGEEKEEAAPKRPPSHSAFFPPWGVPGFDWHLAPVAGLRYASDTAADGTTEQTATSELGARAGLADIPIMPGNPGLGLGIGALEAWGVVTNGDTANSALPKTVTYKRMVGSVGLTGYYGCLREALTFDRGRIAYSDQGHTLVQTAHGNADTGVLILAWLSGHYTFDYLRVFGEQFNQPLLIQTDHWLHGRVTANLLHFAFDLGPGVTIATETEPSPASGPAVSSSGQADYVKAQTSMHLFWKLGASGSAKYYIDSTATDLGTYADTRLPEQDLAQQSDVIEPADSVQAQVFLGLTNVIAGLGFGYHYDLQILNLGRHGGRERLTTRDSGIGMTFAAAL